MTACTMWRRVGDTFYLPEPVHQLPRPLHDYEVDRFSELHYGRRTYYTIHDRNRLDRVITFPRQVYVD